jgi:hypothetical protein
MSHNQKTDIQNISQKTKDQVTRTPLKLWGELMCSEKHYIGYHVSRDVLKISSSYIISPTGGKAYGIIKKAWPLEAVRPTILPYLKLTVIPQTTSGTMLIHTKSNKSQQTIYCKY